MILADKMLVYTNIIIISVLFIYIPLTSGQDRQVSDFINPGCGNTCANFSAALIHVIAKGVNDTLHHVWDFTSKPTIFLALTSTESQLNIDWPSFLWNGAKGSVNFTTKPTYVFSVTFNKIIEFNDVNNTGIYDPNNRDKEYMRILDTKNFTWVNHKENIPNGALFSFKGSNTMKQKDGFIDISLSAFGYKDHSDMQPHLLHTSNATQIDFVFNNLKTHFNYSRFAVEVIVVNTNKKNDLFQNKKKSLDDEHSAGIFTVSEVLTPNEEHQHGYLQWRKVAYTSKERMMTNSTDVTDDRALHVVEPKATLLGTFTYAYFMDELDSLPVNSMFVSFGAQDDGFYSKSKYTSWTLLAGVGHPAEERFSMLVILILSIGLLGIPILIIAFGTLYLIARRISNTRDDVLF